MSFRAFSMSDMLEKLETACSEALDNIAAMHESDAARRETKPILLDVFHLNERKRRFPKPNEPGFKFRYTECNRAD